MSKDTRSEFDALNDLFTPSEQEQPCIAFAPNWSIQSDEETPAWARPSTCERSPRPGKVQSALSFLLSL